MTTPDQPSPKPAAPSDEEIAAMLEQATPGRKKKKRDDTKPSPRLPEALYYYLFMLLEGVIVMGVWGFMKRDPREVLKGPTIEDPILDQIEFHFMSMLRGFGDVVVNQPWLPAIVAIVSMGVFMPVTPRSRKKAATLLSSVIVAAFILLIAIQFSEDMARASQGL